MARLGRGDPATVVSPAGACSVVWLALGLARHLALQGGQGRPERRPAPSANISRARRQSPQDLGRGEEPVEFLPTRHAGVEVRDQRPPFVVRQGSGQPRVESLCFGTNFGQRHSDLPQH